ncbi:hypothetical protein ACFXPW_08750 [Streptomyces goshikiensis]|uniref:hypothetical protein n=1 Tax=Streptomyces goshikiensis TaxID=1942 RepID=UPI0036AA6BA7
MPQASNDAPRQLSGSRVIAASKGNHGGRPKGIDDEMLTFAITPQNKGVPVPEIVDRSADAP